MNRIYCNNFGGTMKVTTAPQGAPLAEILQSPSDSGYLRLRELLEKSQFSEAIDFAHNNEWALDGLVKAVKEQISFLMKVNPRTALELIFKMRDAFPGCGSILADHFANEMACAAGEQGRT